MHKTSVDTSKNDYLIEESMVAITAALSDASRIKMLCALMDGRAWTATELSVVADIAPSTASAHLSRLMKGDLITCLSQGRHRYYRLAGSDIASLIETIMGISWKKIPTPTVRVPLSLRHARTCYDHLAGEIAVKIYRFMQDQNWLSNNGTVITPLGQKQFQQLGVVLDPHTKRKTCCTCLDWSERRFHLGGDAGAALLMLCEQKGWIIRTPGFREVRITNSGKLAFRRWFAIE